jgi:RNA polymerase sigma factor (sigma-70 family)
MRDAVETDDQALVAAFGQSGSEAAFREIVHRHATWVYAAAFRQLRDSHLAEDAVQAVFVLLCRRIKESKAPAKLSGWLFLTVQFTVRSMIRAKLRRQLHERQAAAERAGEEMPTIQINDQLDRAVAQLPLRYRSAIVLRFYQGMEFDAMARDLGISEEAARKRISRAIARLRSRLGAAVSTGSVAAALSAGAVADAAALIDRTSSVAISAASGAPVPSGVAMALKAMTTATRLTQLTIAICSALVLLIVAVGGLIFAWLENESSAPTPPPPTVVQAAPQSARRSLQSVAVAPLKFADVYALGPNETIRWVKPPYIPARMDFYRQQDASQAAAIPAGPDGMMFFVQPDGSLQINGMMFSGGRGYQFNDLVSDLLATPAQDMEGDRKLINLVVKGDFVVRTSAGREEYRKALEKLASTAAGFPVSLTYRDVQRPVVVFKGTWDFKPIAMTKPIPGLVNPRLELYGNVLNKDLRIGAGGSGNIDELGRWISDWIHTTAIMDVKDAPPMITWHEDDAFDVSKQDRKHAHDLELVCNHIKEQTGLDWTKENRMVSRLFIERAAK